MKKLLFAMILLIFLCGCSQNNTVEFNNSEVSTEELAAEPQTENNIVQTEHEEETSEKDYEVEIIQLMITTDENMTIEKFVESLNQSENTIKYYVYDDTHYSHTIKESQRKEYITTLIDNKEVENAFSELFTAQEYNGAFLSMEYDNNFSDVKFYVDRTKYDSLGMFINIIPVMTSALVSDTVQAYNLVPIEERGCTVKIIDNETKEVVYDSSVE